MKLTYALLAAALATSLPAQADKAMAKEAKGVMKEFGGALLSEVQKSMKAVGPVGTIAMCNVKAPMIAKQVSDDKGWDVSRTSLKYRNPGNKPEAWELKVLNDFEARKASGEEVKPMAFMETVTENGKKTFRFVKAIPTGKVCLNCHGVEVAPGVEAKLKELYPNDKARGYKAGDIRGAFVLKKTY